MSSKKTLTAQQASQVSPSSAQFIKLFEADKNRLYAYIYAYVLNHAAADDIFQDSSLTLWREFDTFELGTNFSKWANGIAFNRIRHYKRTNNRYMLDLGDDLLQELQQNMLEEQQLPETKPEKWWHLQHCTALLSDPLKNIYHAFYLEKYQAQEIAEQTGRSIHGIRKSVHKLRQKLFDCIETKNEDTAK